MTVEIGSGGPDDGERKPVDGAEEARDERPLFELIEELDGQRVRMVEMLEQMIVAEGADMEKIDTVFSYQLKNKTKPLLRKVIGRLGEDYELGAAGIVDVVATFWLQFENHNIELLRKITPDTDYQELKLENIKKMIEDLGTDSELDARNERMEGIAFTMTDNYSVDLSRAADSLVAIRMMNQSDGGDAAGKEQKINHRDSIQVKQNFGGHVLDALKLTVGVAGGIAAGLALDRLLRRKK